MENQLSKSRGGRWAACDISRGPSSIPGNVHCFIVIVLGAFLVAAVAFRDSPE